jgi:deazaflavin-dependent oxidoreductase (nitroreductase family)
MASKTTERLRGVANQQTLILTHYGRKTGRPYDVTIWYMVDGDRLYLASANAKRNWSRNVKARPAVSLKIGDQIFNGNVREITETQEREKVRDLVERKYWYAMPIMRVGRFLASTGLMRDNTAAFEVILADE